jgi:uncharacterized protein (DUF433 family)
MSETTNANPLIVETPRGPSIAGTRVTVYSVMDFFKKNRSREYILRRMPMITAEQLDAVYDYVEQHREEVELAYERILRRSEEARAESERIMRERTPDLFDLSPEELRRRLLQKLEEKQGAPRSQNGNHDPR